MKLRLRVTREALGFDNQAPFARHVRIAATAWNNYERGVRLIPPREAGKLCAVLGVTFDWIYRGDLSGVRADVKDKIQAREAAMDKGA